ncbi:MAG: hexokinase [Sporomusaceae bacterium]|nr:hexokinase [Sporomusaceae bacterium]
MTAAALKSLILTDEQLEAMAADFCQQMERKDLGKSSDFKMLSSYLSPATGQERGTFLTLDFGGTNVRLLEVELLGARRFQSKRQILFPLKSEYADYTSSERTGAELFGAIADKIAAFVEPENPYFLGHTFSFPFQQTMKNEAVLLAWTKEIRTSGVVGQDVTNLLKAALLERSLGQIQPVAVLNDTVATLLAASYLTENVTIGVICGTGFNSCCVSEKAGRTEIVNLESGNFSLIPATVWDRQLDANSDCPGSQHLEKAVSGGYLGKLATIVLSDLTQREVSCTPDFSGAALAALLQASEQAQAIAARYGIIVTASESALLCDVAQKLVDRSALLAAASFAGILRYHDPKLRLSQRIAIDGSLYEKMPGYSKLVREGLVRLFGEKAERIELTLCKDGSGIGAAVAAAMEAIVI